METIICIFCNDGESKPLLHENGFTGRKCTRCGLIYISPRPSTDEIANLYGHDEANISAEQHVAAESYKRLHARNILHILKKHASNGKLLEIGPGAGFFMDEARSAGFSPCGIELNRMQAEFIRNKLLLPCESATVAEAFPGEQFDVVYHCDVTSHFPDPIAEFSAMKQRLNANGILIFETGNMGDVRPDLLPQVPRYQYPDHLFFLSTANIGSLLQRTGFNLLGVSRYSIAPELWMNRTINRLRGRYSPNAINGGNTKGSNQNGHSAKVRPMSPLVAPNALLSSLPPWRAFTD